MTSGYSWHEDFYSRKVFPQVCRAAGECAGFWAWLEVSERQMYDEIIRLEQLIDEIWLAAGDREQFQQACRAWYKEVMAGLGKWRLAMALPPPAPVEPKQERMALK